MISAEQIVERVKADPELFEALHWLVIGCASALPEHQEKLVVECFVDRVKNSVTNSRAILVNEEMKAEQKAFEEAQFERESNV